MTLESPRLPRLPWVLRGSVAVRTGQVGSLTTSRKILGSATIWLPESEEAEGTLGAIFDQEAKKETTSDPLDDRFQSAPLIPTVRSVTRGKKSSHWTRRARCVPEGSRRPGLQAARTASRPTSKFPKERRRACNHGRRRRRRVHAEHQEESNWSTNTTSSARTVRGHLGQAGAHRKSPGRVRIRPAGRRRFDEQAALASCSGSIQSRISTSSTRSARRSPRPSRTSSSSSRRSIRPPPAPRMPRPMSISRSRITTGKRAVRKEAW